MPDQLTDRARKAAEEIRVYLVCYMSHEECEKVAAIIERNMGDMIAEKDKLISALVKAGSGLEDE